MSRSHRLDPLLRVTQQRQDAVAKQLSQREQALKEQQQRLELLQQYAASFDAAPVGTTLAPAMLANRAAFRARLDVAIQQQTQTVDASRRSCDIERARLLLASRDNKVLEKLAASYRAEERRAEARREQRELDDHGSRRAAATHHEEN